MKDSTRLTRSRSAILFQLLVLWACLFVGTSALATPPTFGPAAVLNSTAYADLHPYAEDVNPHMATDGASSWVVVWESQNDLGDTIGRDEDIFFARSSDNGFTWTPVAALNTDAATDRPPGGVFAESDLDVCPRIATDAQGNWVTAWLRNLGYASNSLLLVARSNDNGATWSDPTLVSSLPDYNKGCPSLTTDGAGTWILVTGQSGGLRAHDNLFTRSFDNGASWTPLAVLSEGLADKGASRASMHQTDPGEWLALWKATDPPGSGEPADQHSFYSRSTDNGETWSVAARLLPISDPNVRDFPTSVATDSAGNWVIAWTALVDGDVDVFFSRSTDNTATWTTPAYLNSDAATDSDSDAGVRLAADSLGTWVAIWNSDNTLGDTIGEDRDIFYAVSEDNGATWSDEALLNSSYAATDPDSYYGDDNPAQLVADGSGRFLALWVGKEVEKYEVGTRWGFIGRDKDLLVSLSDHLCGNGSLDLGEDCDDANRFDRDCCDSTCTFEPAQSLCTPDADLCSADICDGAGLCEHLLTPRPGCRKTTLPGKAKLVVRDDPENSRDKFIWSWAKGEATEVTDFDDPVTNNDMEYTLCVFDQSAAAQPIMQATAPGNSRYADDCRIGLCDWKKSGRRGFRYSDRQLANDGLRKIRIRAGDEGRARIKAIGSGENLPLAQLPLTSPVVVQLRHSENDICWDAEFSTFRRNDTSQLKARGD